MLPFMVFCRGENRGTKCVFNTKSTVLMVLEPPGQLPEESDYCVDGMQGTVSAWGGDKSSIEATHCCLLIAEEFLDSRSRTPDGDDGSHARLRGCRPSATNRRSPSCGSRTDLVLDVDQAAQSQCYLPTASQHASATLELEHKRSRS